MIKVTLVERRNLRSYEYLCRTEEEVQWFVNYANTDIGKREFDLIIERESDSDSPRTS